MIQIGLKDLPATRRQVGVWENGRGGACHCRDGANGMFDIKRREFITLLGGVAVWPALAPAHQPPPMPGSGFLPGGSPEPNARRLAGFRKGLNEAGFVEGRNVAIEFRWAEG